MRDPFPRLGLGWRIISRKTWGAQLSEATGGATAKTDIKKRRSNVIIDLKRNGWDVIQKRLIASFAFSD